MTKPKIEFVTVCCATCRYWRFEKQKHCCTTNCLLLGRGLSIGIDQFDWQHRARVCSGWKKRPENWYVVTEKNPFWYDPYIPRKTQLRLRKKQEL